MLVLAKSRQRWYIVLMNRTLVQAVSMTQCLPEAQQEALRGEGYTEAEVRHRMDARVAAAGL